MSEGVLVKVDNVGKRFCRSLKPSLWYGLQDLGSEIGGRHHGGCLPPEPSGSPAGTNPQSAAPPPPSLNRTPRHSLSLRLPPPLRRILQPLRSQEPAAQLMRQTARQQWRLLAANLGGGLVQAFGEGTTLAVETQINAIGGLLIELLILDEAIERFERNHTVLVIAHRLSSIVRADQILVLESGRVVQRGSHSSLLAEGGLYQQLWLQQSMDAT